ncbi:MAG: MqnA/MqnD/SBP family protein [Bacteroidota bacterium]
MQSAKHLGIPESLYCRPFIEGLRDEDSFRLVHEQPAEIARRLETRGLDAAFLSPIDYARNASEYLIIPGSAVSSAEGNNAVVIHFREGATNVRTLAVRPSSASDIVLARIMLAERFDLNPRIVPVMGALEEMLAKADAALLTADAAMEYALSRPSALDLVEEWIAATDLPYVHGFWAGREDSLSKHEWDIIAGAADRGYTSLQAQGEPVAGALETFSYDLTDDVQEGIREFLRYAYYHGILPDVPDLRFFGTDVDSPSRPALN